MWHQKSKKSHFLRNIDEILFHKHHLFAAIPSGVELERNSGAFSQNTVSSGTECASSNVLTLLERLLLPTF